MEFNKCQFELKEKIKKFRGISERSILALDQAQIPNMQIDPNKN